MESVLWIIFQLLVLGGVWFILKNMYLRRITKYELEDGSILVKRDQRATRICIADIDGIELTSASQVIKFKKDTNYSFLNNRVFPFHMSAFGGFMCMETLIIYMKTGKHYVIYFARERDRVSFMALVGEG